MSGPTDSEKPQRTRSKKEEAGRTKYRISYVEKSTSGEKSDKQEAATPRETSKRSPKIQRKHRIKPEETMADGPTKSSTRKSRKGKSALVVDTSQNGSGCKTSSITPNTASSTPSAPGNAGGVRGSRDLRSPGGHLTPVSSEETPIPDFITQTDRYGNATTPRSADAIDAAKGRDKGDQTEKDGENQDELNIDPCETLLDSIRLMCCCLIPEESAGAQKRDQEGKGEIDTTATTASFDKDEEHVKLLPEMHPGDKGKKCLVLDLDETLVHSSFRAVRGADFVIPVQIEDVVHFVYVAKRPGVDEFLVEMAKHYEIVVYTASLNKYADPLLDLLDPNKVIRTRLFRESCVYFEGNYVKDLSLLDRDLTQCIIVDNSPNSYIFHPENAIDCTSFIDDPNDRELDQIAAFLKGIRNAADVRHLSNRWREWPDVDFVSLPKR